MKKNNKDSRGIKMNIGCGKEEEKEIQHNFANSQLEQIAFPGSN